MCHPYDEPAAASVTEPPRNTKKYLPRLVSFDQGQGFGRNSYTAKTLPLLLSFCPHVL
jgi:hypothetical protein